MYPYRALLTLGTLAMSLGVGSAAKASSDIALSFELPPSPQEEAEAAAIAEAAAAPPAPEPQPQQALVNADAPLPIPPGAENPPLASDNTRPAGVYGGLDAIALGASPSVQALLPPPPPVPDYVQQIMTAIAPPLEPAVVEPAPEPEPKIPESIEFDIGFLEKTFAEPAPEPAPDAAPQLGETVAFTDAWENPETLFAGGTDSLVAWAVGSAEGTRTPEGHKNPAYYGHVDPGNGVWNLGTFSYQHGASTPEEADAKQLLRLQNQTAQLRQKAQEKGLQLTKEELLNGIDLANQAPLAALDQGGYIDWLQKAHSLGMQGSEAIVWARTRSFIDPDTQRWNAPGLGNNVYSISHDQERRAHAIARAISAFTSQTQIAVAPAPNDPVTSEVVAPETEPAPKPQEKIAFDVQLLSPRELPQRGQEIAAAAEISAPAESDQPEPVAVAPKRVEDAEPAIAMADPVTGLLFTAGFLPDAQAAGQTLSRLAEQPNRPIFSRLNSTLSRILQGRQTPLAESVQGTAIAPETSAEDSTDSAAAVSPANADETAAVSPVSTADANVIPADAESVAQEGEILSPPLEADAPAAQPLPDTAVATKEPLHESRDIMTDTELVDAPPPATARPRSLRSLAPEAAAAPPLDLSLSAVDEITPPVEGESVAPSPAASSFSEIEPTAETPPSLETADDAPAPEAVAASESDRHAKAPAKLTDADELKRQTLESLDQFQKQLRRELND